MLSINILIPTVIEATERMNRGIRHDINLLLSGTISLRRTSMSSISNKLWEIPEGKLSQVRELWFFT